MYEAMYNFAMTLQQHRTTDAGPHMQHVYMGKKVGKLGNFPGKVWYLEGVFAI